MAVLRILLPDAKFATSPSLSHPPCQGISSLILSRPLNAVEERSSGLMNAAQDAVALYLFRQLTYDEKFQG